MQRYERGHGWHTASLDDLLATDDPAALTCMYVHGNNTPLSDAVQIGHQVWRSMTRSGCARRLRFILYTWPSDRIHRKLVPDGRIKAARVDSESYYLAMLLRRFQPGQSVSLFGYSFGARTIAGALHLYGGGAIGGRRLSGESPETFPLRLRAVLFAAAFNFDWMIPGRRYGEMLRGIERLSLTMNPCDFVLERYHWLHCDPNARALGAVGAPRRSLLGDWGDKIHQINAASYVGREHSSKAYLGSGNLMAWARREAVTDPIALLEGEGSVPAGPTSEPDRAPTPPANPEVSPSVDVQDETPPVAESSRAVSAQQGTTPTPLATAARNAKTGGLADRSRSRFHFIKRRR